ncbi:MAG: hypothetical protein M1383_03845 [Patescibacteria group bacterium]|nr:hypothetical protein [Patescibacteria group bacterium]
MTQKTKHFYMWAGVGAAVLVAAGLVIYQADDYKQGEELVSIEGILSTIKNGFHGSAGDLKTYQNQDLGFSFQYPSKLSPAEKSGVVELSHQIPYQNHGDCDMKGDEQTYDNLTDFKASFQIYNGTAAQAARKMSPYLPAENFSGDTLKISPGFIDKYQVGNLTGFSIYEGVEGCGHTVYYFPVSGNRVLVAENMMVQALSGIFSDMREKEILAIPGAISRQENRQILEQILSSVKFTDPSSLSPSIELDTNNWKIYRNEEYGFEFKYPGDWKIRPEGNVITLTTPQYDFNMTSEPGQGKILVMVLDNLKSLSIQDWLTQSPDFLSQSEAIKINTEAEKNSWPGVGYDQQSVVMGGKTALKQNLDGEGGSNLNLIVPIGNKIMVVSLVSDYQLSHVQSLVDTFNLIISTFEFSR